MGVIYTKNLKICADNQTSTQEIIKNNKNMIKQCKVCKKHFKQHLVVNMVYPVMYDIDACVSCNENIK